MACAENRPYLTITTPLCLVWVGLVQDWDAEFQDDQEASASRHERPRKLSLFLGGPEGFEGERHLDVCDCSSFSDLS